MDSTHYSCLINFFESLIDEKISPQEMLDIKLFFKPTILQKNEYFLCEGDIPTKIAFNTSGLLRSFYIDKAGNDITKYFSFPNSIVGYPTVVQKLNSKYYIQALEDSFLLTIEYTKFQELTNDNLLWLKVINKLQEMTLIYKEERESSFLLQTASERYLGLIESSPNIINQDHP